MKKKLDELCDIVRGSSPRPQGDVRYYGGSIPRLMVSDLTRDGMFVMPMTDSLTEAGAKLSRPMSKGDLVIAVSGNPGLPAILKTDACIHDGFVGLRNLSEIVYTEYLYYYLFYNKNINHALAVGAIFKNLTTDQIKNLTIPLPDFKTQQKIAQILSKADKARQLRRTANALTDQFLQNTFLSIFGDPLSNSKGWKMVECFELFEMKLGKMLSAKNYTGTHLKPYLRNANIKWGDVDLSDVNQMDFSEKEVELYSLKKNDILVCEGGEVGKTAILMEDMNGFCFQNAIHRLRMRSNNNIEPYYFYWLMFIGVKNGLIKKETISVTIAHFTLEKFKKLKIPLPPFKLQQQFADIVTETKQLRQRQRVHEQELEQLFKGLLQKYFG